MKKIAIIGFGVVGSGVYEIVRNNADVLEKSIGDKADVSYVLDIRDFSDHEESRIFTKNFDDILNDSDVSLVVETMGGVKFAYDYTKRLLESGKSVVTSNKELVEKHGREFFEIAKQNNVRYMYEAAVGGGIPIIRPLACDIAANNIKEISGILNGTTNYILTKMFDENDSYENALLSAQKLGYAEKDPTADVDGHDACRKISILMSLITGRHINSERVHTVGIRSITAEDVLYAAAVNCTIKLVACGFIKDGKVSASVEPMLVQKDIPLAVVNGVFNAVTVKGDMVDTLFFYGRGAGKLPTASAVVGDVIDVLRNPSYNSYYSWGKEDASLEIPYEEVKAKFFVRINENQITKALEEFGDIEIIRGVSDCGFVSPEMTVAQLKKHTDNLGGVISAMRLYR